MKFVYIAVLDSGTPSKKSKQPRYQLTRDQKALIKADTANKKVWDDVLGTIRSEGSVSLECQSMVHVLGCYYYNCSFPQAGLLGRIQEAFLCIVCQELVFQPITTTCSHNICKVSTQFMVITMATYNVHLSCRTVWFAPLKLMSTRVQIVDISLVRTMTWSSITPSRMHCLTSSPGTMVGDDIITSGHAQ